MSARPDPLSSSRLRFKLELARLALFWEALWSGVWPAVALLGLFVILALFNVWAFLPYGLHVALLLAFALLFLAALLRSRGSWKWPDRQAAMARLEADSGLPHQPLRAATDDLALGREDGVSRRLWAAHRERLLGMLGRLRPRAPRSHLPERDPWALRALLLLLLTIGLVEADGKVGARLWEALLPRGAGGSATAAPSVEVWFTPPAYTGRAPFKFDPSTGSPARVPEHSRMHVQLYNLPGTSGSNARLMVSEKALDFEPLGEGNAEADVEVVESGEAVVRLAGGEELARYALEVVPDRPPKVEFVDLPKVTRRMALELSISATDDYGLSELALRVEAPEASDEPGGKAERHLLLRPAKQPREWKSRVFLDLTSHPRAGLPVILRLEARDAQGQVGVSGPLEFTLPERAFRHPLARAVIALRRDLVDKPARWALVAQRLRRLAAMPEALELGTAVPLSLDVAASRLERQRNPEGRRSVVDLLWEIALFIEDGALSIAERRLRELQDALQKALSENAPESELEKLLQELQQALENYMDELARQAAEQMAGRQNQEMPFQPIDPSRLLRREDLQRMLEEARRLMQSGMRDQARQLLSQLREMLENMQTAMPRMQPTPGEQAMGDLQQMIELQRKLLEESYRMRRQGPNLGMPPSARRPDGRQQQGQAGKGRSRPQASGQMATEQEGLRRALGELMRRLGEAGMRIPRALGQAELEMRGARDALAKGDPGGAIGPQTQALDFMQQGGQAILEQLREQMANQPGNGQTGIVGRRSRDPLGRAMRNEGGYQTEGVQIPKDYDLGRARGVLEELYRRSGQRDRPGYELDYYNRLLDRF